MTEEYQAIPLTDEQYEAIADAVINGSPKPEILPNPPLDFCERMSDVMSRKLGKPVQFYAVTIGDVEPTGDTRVTLPIYFEYASWSTS